MKVDLNSTELGYILIAIQDSLCEDITIKNYNKTFERNMQKLFLKLNRLSIQKE